MKKSNTKDFIEKAIKKHGNKYDYSKVEYKSRRDKVLIICPKHGEFWQNASSHLSGCGCPECGNVRKITTKSFIEKAKKVHGDKYDYSKVDITGSNKTKICLICPTHGEFWQTPNAHLNGQGCPKCPKQRNYKYSLEEFIDVSNKIHNSKYDYSSTIYESSVSKVIIKCPIHGEFLQRPVDHIRGHGCPHCMESHLEAEIKGFLSSKSILFEEQKTFDWLGRQSLDFYLPQYNVAIECQGGQHFKPVKRFGGINTFKEIVKRDKIKKKLCDDNGIKILYYTDFKFIYPYKVYTNKNKLLNDIINE
jgi:hypothetical protein